jgi:hypothetical protein
MSAQPSAIWTGPLWAADGEELACDGIAALASAPARCHPAAIPVQIGHRVADGYATHAMAHADHHASEVKTENDGGRPPHEIEVGQLILQRVERRGGDADQNLVGRRLRDGNTHRLGTQTSPPLDLGRSHEAAAWSATRWIASTWVG